ncbi:MAG TPA: hypothetical protein VNN09_13665 [Candidatus Competibacteraceae bacterium]|nr:hypothetical protein [Candidatus Competibacteraceae bacterium]
MPLYNYFNLRWAEGYSYVSDAPNRYNILIESQIGTGGNGEEGGSVEVIYNEASRLYLGVLKCTLYLPALERPATYLHVVVIDELPKEHRFNADCLLATFRERYGEDVEAAIAALYNELALLSKAEGRGRLRPYEIGLSMLMRQSALLEPAANEPQPPPIGATEPVAAPLPPTDWRAALRGWRLPRFVLGGLGLPRPDGNTWLFGLTGLGLALLLLVSLQLYALSGEVRMLRQQVEALQEQLRLPPPQIGRRGGL